MSDMTACLNDLSYIPSNNEQNEPTQGDIVQISNELTQAIRNEFEELYASAIEELYPGCNYSLDFNVEIEDGDPPRKFDQDDIMAQLAKLPTRVKGKHMMYKSVKIKCDVLVELNWTKRSIFYELEYWSFLTLKHNLDVMHIEKNVLESILNTLLMNEKSKDTTKADKT
ncbi:hypothetical protein Tco_0902268 [Tanacetum coccineum]